MKSTNNREFGSVRHHWLLMIILVALLGAIGQGCLPPPPRQAPKPPTPPGGPHPDALIDVRPSNNFNNFSV